MFFRFRVLLNNLPFLYIFFHASLCVYSLHVNVSYDLIIKYMYVCMYVCMYLCMYVSMYVCTCEYVLVLVCMYPYLFVCVCCRRRISKVEGCQTCIQQVCNLKAESLVFCLVANSCIFAYQIAMGRVNYLCNILTQVPAHYIYTSVVFVQSMLVP